MSLSPEATRSRWQSSFLTATPRRRKIVGLIVVYLSVYFLIDADAVTRQYSLTPEANLNVAEARAWLSGRLDLDCPTGAKERPWDSAVFEDRVYNVFPPLFSVISAVVLSVSSDGVPNVVLIVLLALPLPGLAYALFLKRTEGVTPAVLLSIGYLLGTSLAPVMNEALRNGDVWRVNHLLSQLGLLIFLLDYFGQRRIWLAGVGLILAAWSRQLTALYMIPLAVVALRGMDEPQWRRRAITLGLTLAVLVALPATLNTLKFGDPLDSGYARIYEGRWDDAGDQPAQDARGGLFGLSFVPRNLYYMNLGLPLPDRPLWMLRFVPNPFGTGIWWTSPLLLLAVLHWRRLWSDPYVRGLLVAAVLVFAVIMAYHTTGRAQRGYSRFSLDFVLVLLAAIGPVCSGPRRQWVIFGLVTWSVWYFRWAI